MSARRILSDAQLDELVSFRDRGWGVDRIAAHFTEAGTKVSVGSISWQCLRLGADTLPKFRGKSTQPTAPYRRGNAVVRPYSPEDDALLRQLERQGISIAAIARRLGRKANSIRGRLLTLTRRDTRAEEAAA